MTDEYPDGSGGRSSDFELGTLKWSAAHGVLEVFAAVPCSAPPAAGDWVHTSSEERMRYALSSSPFDMVSP